MSHNTPQNLQEHIAAQLAPRLLCGRRLQVGLSGGLDSVVLLHGLHALAPRFGYALEALHVHHGISLNADAWADFCRALCARLQVPLQLSHVELGDLCDTHGIEAAARKLRYAAYAASGAPYVALAHHADDQAETLMLQLLRGAGLRGVAAMPAVREQGGQTLLRPLLDLPRSVLLDYARQHGLKWVEDESNRDDSYPRNFVRHRLFPVLEQRFPAWRHTLGRSARHFAEAAGMLDEIARADMRSSDALAVDALQALVPARARNLLRYFLHGQGAPMPQEAQLDEMLRQLCSARDNADVCVDYGGWQVRRYRGRVHVLPALPDFDASYCRSWQGETELYWPPLQCHIRFETGIGQGISRARLGSGPVTLRLRSGGETLRPHPAAARRSLKNLLQQHAVPPWQRERLPLLYCGEKLVAVVDVAIAAGYQAQEGEAGIVVACG